MKGFLTQNWFIILLALIFLGYAVYLMIAKQWVKLREQAYALMLTAERLFEDNEGRKKFEAVFEKLYYDLIPAWLRLFVSPEFIREQLQEWYDLAKDCVDDGTADSSQFRFHRMI